MSNNEKRFIKVFDIDPVLKLIPEVALDLLNKAKPYAMLDLPDTKLASKLIEMYAELHVGLSGGNYELIREECNRQVNDINVLIDMNKEDAA